MKKQPLPSPAGFLAQKELGSLLVLLAAALLFAVFRLALRETPSPRRSTRGLCGI